MLFIVVCIRWTSPISNEQHLTSYGLWRMTEVMDEDEVSIFFGNNRFSTIYKRKGQILELVTSRKSIDLEPKLSWRAYHFEGAERKQQLRWIGFSDHFDFETTKRKKTKKQKQANTRCVVCLSKQRRYLCAPCGHLCLCENCIQRMKRKCPICRAKCKFIQVFK